MDARPMFVQRKKVPVRVPDRAYWREQIRCQQACPVHTDARGYIRAIAAGDYERAYLIARGPNPFASVCGRVCGAPCEASCRRGELDQPVSIRALKRFVCERFATDSSKVRRDLPVYLREASRRMAPRSCQGAEELLPLLQALTKGDIEPVSGLSVAIVGSGPAGLAAAHDLALMGFQVTVFEMEKTLGGMLALGVPEYRLPRDLIQAEIDVVRAMGIREVTGTMVGRDLSLAELRESHDAVIIAVGAKRSRWLDIPGARARGVYGGVEYLHAVATGQPLQMGEKVVVIGGGNVAFDVGRTVLRQISFDAARTAARDHAVKAVHLCSLESRQEMPADDVEIIEGDEEGILRHNSVGPVEILTDRDGAVSGIVLRKCLRVFDEEGRFNPVFDDQVRTRIPCDNVLLAVGQGFDLSFVDPVRDGLEMTERGLISCDAVTGRTSAPDLFISGDLAYGPKLLIHAVASGKATARAVYESLTGRSLQFDDVDMHLSLAGYQREPDFEKVPRVRIPTAGVQERLRAQDEQVERPFSSEDARREAGRCLDCGVNTIFDGSRCILCGGCVEVCPELCLRIVSADRLAAAEAAAPLPDRLLDPHETGQLSAIVKDETSCIRCALCAERCPTGAITMDRYQFKEVPRCPAV